jgi:hypothetical protein
VNYTTPVPLHIRERAARWFVAMFCAGLVLFLALSICFAALIVESLF